MTPSALARAIDAYSSAQRPDALRPGADAAGAPGFAGLVRAELSGAAAGLRGAEAATIAGVTGRMGMQEVVETVAQAELALQKVTAVRDRVIAAYQEVMRMPM